VSEVSVSVGFFCPKCINWVVGEIRDDAGRYYTVCPKCEMGFEVSVKVSISEQTLKLIASERLRRLQKEYCEFNGVGYTLKKEYWGVALKSGLVKDWQRGENGYAYLTSYVSIRQEDRPPEPFWCAHYFALGDFQDISDTTKPEKIKTLYVVEDEKEAEFIKRVKIR
jgi:hypothetical protein